MTENLTPAEIAEREVFYQNRAWFERHELVSGRREHVNAAIDVDHVEALAENERRRVAALPTHAEWMKADNAMRNRVTDQATRTDESTPKLTDSDGARRIIENGGRVHRDDRYSGDYKYIVDSYGPARNRVTDAEARTDADALRDTANHHQGTRVHAADDQHGRQLRRQGLVGPRGGLTRRGSIVAERLRNAALDDAFGPL